MTLKIFAELQNIRRELVTIRQIATDFGFYVRNAECEVPEKFRRFANYMHDLHSIKWMYEESGHPVPRHIMDEMERCDDRFRQLLKEQHTDGGTFEKVRRDMAADPENKWDHTRLLFAPKENS